MKAIAVVDKNLAIGKNGNLLCRLPKDLAHFKEETLGKTLIMGRKTLESLPGGKPLPGRKTLVLSKSEKIGVLFDDGKYKSFMLTSPQKVLEYIAENCADENVFVAGGAQIYREFFDYCDELILTELDCEFKDADAFFPEFHDSFKMIRQGEVAEDNGFLYRINRYSRI